MVWYPRVIVTVPLQVPLHVVAGTRQWAVSVTVWYGGPQDANVDGLAVRLTLLAPVPLTLALRVTPVVGGAHLNESVALPVPVLAANVIVRGFVDQRAFGWELAAKPTAA